MRLRTLALCSASAVLMAAAATPTAWAQTVPADAESQATAQEAPNDPNAAPPQTDDAVQGEEDATEVEAVVVTGLRRSLQSAQSIRRNSDQIVDAVVAEDIGKLPDVTASDSLARVTGVQVERSGGEAGRVLVRGLPDITTTYNGREIFTAEARFVAVQDFPAGGVAALEVFKSTTANLVEGGIAGLINVRSRRPFDFADREIAGSLNATYANQSGKYDGNGNLLLSDRWDTGAGEVGALINVSYTQLRFLDSARFNGGVLGTAGAGQVSSPAQAGFRFPDAVGIFYGQADRSRPSVNAALQWRPRAGLEFYADFLYQGFRREVEDRRLFVPLFGDARFSNVVLRPGGNAAQSLTVTGAVAPFLFQGATDEATDTYQFGAGVIYTTGPFRISADLAHTDSVFDLSIYSFDTAFVRSPVTDVNFDVDREDGGVEFSFRDFDTTNPLNYNFGGLFDRHLIASGDDVQFRTDLEYETGIDIIPDLQFGFRFSDRNGAFENGQRFGPGTGRLIDQPVELAIFHPGFRGSDVQPTRVWVSPTRDSIRDNIELLRSRAGFRSGRPPADPLSVFEANEKSYAAYGQLNYDFENVLPVRVDGVLGLRVVKTELDITGTQQTFAPNAPNVPIFTPRTVQTETTDYLPSFNARVHLTDALQLRLAANKTRTRPGFGQLNPTLNVSPNVESGGFRNASGGNPELEPLESNNYDAALEYYFSRTGSAIVTVFRREVKGFIADQVSEVTDPVLGRLRLTRPENLNDDQLQGVEAQFTTFFDYEFLPEFARGFGVQVNATFIDTELPGVSERAYNLVGLYERGPVSARLAYNTRSEFTAVGAPLNEFTDDVSRLDFSANFTPIENLTLAFDASNLLGEPFRNFGNYDGGIQYPRDVRFEETVYSLGVRFRF